MGKTPNRIKYVGGKETVEISSESVTIKAIYVTKKGEVNDKMHLYNGKNHEFTVDGEEVQMIPYLNITFESGLTVKFDSDRAQYIIVY